MRAATLAYGRFQTLLGEDYGVRWIENYDCHDDVASRRLLLAAAMGVPVIASRACGLGEAAKVTTVRAGNVASLFDSLSNASVRTRGLR